MTWSGSLVSRMRPIVEQRGRAWDAGTPQHSSLRHPLTRHGTPAHALAEDLVVVTANVSEFGRVPGLGLEKRY